MLYHENLFIFVAAFSMHSASALANKKPLKEIQEDSIHILTPFAKRTAKEVLAFLIIFWSRIFHLQLCLQVA